MAIDTEKLFEALDTAIDNPEHFNMSAWISNGYVNAPLLDNQGQLNCGTTLCLAGWICWLNDRDGVLAAIESKESYPYEEKALTIICGSSDNESIEVFDLQQIFYKGAYSITGVQECISEYVAIHGSNQ